MLQGRSRGCGKALGRGERGRHARRTATCCVAPARLDADRFEAPRRRGAARARRGRPGPRPAALLREALALWRGAPLARPRLERFAQRETARLEELRLRALEQLRRRRPRARPPRRGRRGAAGAGRRAPVPRAPARPADARAVPLRPPGGRARRPTRTRARALVEELGLEPGRASCAARAADARARPGARAPRRRRAPPAGARRRRRPEPRRDARRLVSVVVADLAGVGGAGRAARPGVAARAARALLGGLRRGARAPRRDGRGLPGRCGRRRLRAARAPRGRPAAGRARRRSSCARPCAALGAELERDHGVRVARAARHRLGRGVRRPPTRAGRARAPATRCTSPPALAAAAADGEILLGEARVRRLGAAVHGGAARRRSRVGGRRGDGRPGGCSGSRPRADAARRGRDAVRRARARSSTRCARAGARAGASGACRLVTVVGPPGIGKSRLARELVAGIGDDAAVVVGRCLALRRRAIAYRPLAEMVRQLAATTGAVDPRLLAGDERVESIALRVLGAIGRSDEAAQAGGDVLGGAPALRGGGARAPARGRRRGRPLGRADAARPARVPRSRSRAARRSCCVCLARPELLESRPGVGGAAARARRCWCSSRSAGRRGARAGRDARGAGLDRRAPSASSRRAEGNPLFLEQLAGGRRGGRAATLPPTHRGRARRPHRPARAAASARCSGAPRSRGAASTRGAVAELLPAASGRVGPRAAGARAAAADPARPARVRRRGRVPLRPRADPRGRLRGHAEAAARRAARAAGRLAGRRGRRDATRSSATTSSRPAATAPSSGRRSTTTARSRARGGASGSRRPRRRRCARGDAAAGGAPARARGRRCVAPDDPARPALLPALGAALVEAGRLADADARPGRGDRARRARRRPAAGGARPRRARARAAPRRAEPRRRAGAARSRPPRSRSSSATATTSAAAAPGACARGSSGPRAGRRRPTTRGGEAAEHARRAGDERELFEILGWRASAAAFGPTPVPEAIRRCERIREQVAQQPRRGRR